jgi:tryptophanase
MPIRTIIEPFRIKSVEPIRWTTREQRGELLEAAHYNLCLLPADDVLIDLLTDSPRNVHESLGRHHARGDESYAGSKSFDHLRDSVQDIFGLPARNPYAPGTSRGTHSLLRDVQEGRHRSE